MITQLITKNLEIFLYSYCQVVFENNRKDITVAMMENYPLLLHKFMADKGKVSSLVEIVLHTNLGLYSSMRQEEVGHRISCACRLFNIFEKLNSYWMLPCFAIQSFKSVL